LDFALGSPSSFWAGKDLIACLELAYALLIWQYTGDGSAAFLTGNLNDDGSVCHRKQIVSIPDQTIRSAHEALQQSRAPFAHSGRVSPCVLVHSTEKLNADIFSNSKRWQEAEISVQIFYNRPSLDSHVQLMVWFDSAFVNSFHIATYVQHLADFACVLWQANAEDRLESLDSLTENDKEFLSRSNRNIQDLDNRTIHESIATNADRDPVGLAVDAWDGQLSYTQLQHEARPLTAMLLRSGPRKGSAVAILHEKSKWVPVAMLAVLESGAAFFLLEPSLPGERLKLMVEKAQATQVVTTQCHVALARSLFPNVIVHGDFEYGEQFFEVDSEADSDGSGGPILSPGPGLLTVSPGDPAFVSFTSGSTGVPKAVIASHAAWVTSCVQASKSGITNSTRIFQYASYNYSASVFDMLSALILGGTICIPDPGERMNDLESAIRRFQPDFVYMTSSVAKGLRPERIPSIKTISLVGEPIPASVAETWLAARTITLRNGYGQSEGCGINSTAILSYREANYRSIGHGEWLRRWIVDPQNPDRLLPVGAVGELLLEGHSLASGYINEPEKTAATFIKSPRWANSFSAGLDGRRWYRTGDLAQYQENGELFLFGRGDARFKIHGQRVEAAEIEHHIAEAFRDEIQQVVVDQIEFEEKKLLVAFVTLQPAYVEAEKHGSGESPNQRLRGEMVQRLEGHIQSWMIPNKVITMSAMPRTATGKLDRRALKRTNAVAIEARVTSPTNLGSTGDDLETELKWHSASAQNDFAKLRPLASAILNVEEQRIRPLRSWVALGGDSITAMRLVAEGRKAGLYLTTVQVMSGQTLISMCGQVDPRRRVADKLEESKPVAPVNDSLSLTDFQVEYMPSPEGTHRGLLCKFLFAFPAATDENQLGRALSTWIERTEALRLTFLKTAKGDVVQKVIPSHDSAWRARIHLGIEIQQTDALSSSHDFFQHPVLAVVHRKSHVPSDRARVTLHISHSILDGSSFQHMLHDLVDLSLGTNVPSRPNFTTYLSQRLLRRSVEDLSYWTSLLRDSSPTDLRGQLGAMDPTPRQTLPHLGDLSLRRFIYLDRSHPDQTNTPMSSIVHSAWGLVLAVLSARSDVIFRYLAHGRDEDVDGSDAIIGCCASEVPLRLQILNGMSTAELINTTHNQILQSSPHVQLGSATIAAKCTQWPSTTTKPPTSGYYSSLVHHKNISSPAHIPVGDLGYVHLEHSDWEGDLDYDFDLCTESASPSELYIELRCMKSLYSLQELDAVGRAFVMTMRLLTGAETLSVKELMARLRAVPSLPIVEASSATAAAATAQIQAAADGNVKKKPWNMMACALM
jgi:amino acid adenylation domain-containing protein